MGLRGLSFGLERAVLGPDRTDLGPERGLWEHRRMDGHTDRRTEGHLAQKGQASAYVKA